MKLSKLFFGLATAAMFAACSSDDIVVEKTQVQLNEDGTGFMALNITMPVQKGTRAENDQFTNGEAAEYKVNNVTLILFSDGKFHSAYTLGAPAWNNTDVNGATNPNVTSDNRYVAKVQGDKLVDPQAFVVINHNDIFKVNDSDHSLVVDGVSAAGKTYAQLMDVVYTPDLNLQADAFHTDGFLMMNAPLQETAGGTTGTPTTNAYVLAPIAANQIYATAADAQAAANGSVSVYVERAVAKVTLTEASSVVVASEFKNAAVQKWTLDNTNKKSFIGRSTADFDSWLGYSSSALSTPNYRMTGAETVGHTTGITHGTAGTDAFRTYWAKDPNFDAYNAADFNVAIDAATWAGTEGSDMYCAENTFDVLNMVYKQTTRALVEVKLNDGNDFYSRPGDDKLYDVDAMKNVAAAKASAEAAALKAAGALEGSGTVTFTATKKDDKTFTVKADVALVKSTSVVAGSPEDKAIDDLNNGTYEYTVVELGYQFYKGGVAYYDTRIKHFGDELTPWSVVGDAMTVKASYGIDASSSAAEKEAAANDFLGRWGVLRNNWYELAVTGIYKMGYANPGDLELGRPGDPTPEWPENPDPDTPDDNQKAEEWLSVDVNVLSWAKRFQNVVW